MLAVFCVNAAWRSANLARKITSLRHATTRRSGGDHAGIDDGHAASDQRPDPVRSRLSRRSGDRRARDRRRHPSLHLCGRASTHQAHGAGAQAARHEPRRPRRHTGLEHPSPFRNVLRGAGHGLRAPHRQPAAVSRTARLHHQSCRRPSVVHRPRHAAARRGDRAAAQDDRGLCRDVRARAHARDEARERPLLRRASREGERGRLRLAGVRREVRLDHLLHVGHDGQSQGRDLFAPRRDPADDDLLQFRLPAGPCRGRSRGDDADGAPLPRQWLEHAVHGSLYRLEAGAARPQLRARQAL
ncbi:hypothetical protein ACVIM7_004647 [Bradyrhizobium liaoningense]